MKRHLATIILILSVILIFISKMQKDDDIKHEITKNLQSSLSENILISSTFLSDSTSKDKLNKVEQSTFSIDIYNSDTTFYKSKQVSIHLTQYATVANSNGSDTLSWNISLPINTEIQLEKQLPTFKLSTTGKLNCHIGSNDFDIILAGSFYRNFMLALGWFLLFGVYAYWTYGWSRRSAMSLRRLLPAIILFTGLHYLPAVISYFEGFWGFNPASDSWRPTLSVYLIWLWNFVLLSRISKIYSTFSARYNRIWPMIAGALTAGIFVWWVASIEGFVLSHSIDLDIDALLKFDILAISVMVALCTTMFVVFHFTYTIFSILYNESKPKSVDYWILYGSMALVVLGSSYFGLIHGSTWMILAFVSAFMLIMDAYVDSPTTKITYLIWWMIMFSGFLAVTVYHFSVKKDIAERSAFTEKYYTPPSAEIVRDLENMQDSLIDSRIFTKIASLELPAKIDNQDLDQFLFVRSVQKKFNLNRKIELFDHEGNTLFSNHFANYIKTTQSYRQSEKIGKNVYYNPVESTYIIKIDIASPSMERVWPLFLFYSDENSQTNVIRNRGVAKYNFGLFYNNTLVEHNHINASSGIDIAKLATITFDQVKDGYSYIVHPLTEKYRIVSYKKVSGLIKPISLFSFIFALTGLITLLLSTINTRLDKLPNHMSLKFGSRSSLKTKIQLAIIFLILFTFIVIGTITTYYFTNLIEASQLTKNHEESSSILHNIESDIQNMDDEHSALQFAQTKIKEYAHIHDKTLQLYDASGRILEMPDKKSVSWHIPRHIIDAKTQNIYPVGNIDYIPLTLKSKQPFAFLSIGHRDISQSSNSILDFLSTILNAYIFLFLIAGAIAITIANSITQPLSFLTEKLKKFKLGQTNEPLEWQSNDEIGTLIEDYNNLTQEVERSANILAKTQRDMAWREMAKQVAHEIKNPLTPMKLSIQYLERATQEDPEKAKPLIARISATLVEQIDNLTQIANEFSNFATMPKASNEKIILNEIVEAVHDLFRKRDDMDITMNEPLDDMVVFADRNHLVRILNNLLKNAIQAIPDGRRGNIYIELKRQNAHAIIRVSDNGIGIPDQMKDKVFTPNFTTKSSGTGLGLAISANMIESFNGRIYFDTREGEGTDFYMSIPLMKLDDYIVEDEGDRIDLDS